MIECAFTEESFERGNQIGGMHAMSVTDAHSSLYSSSSMTIHLTINHNTIKDVNKTTLKHLLLSLTSVSQREWEGCQWHLEALVHCMHLCIETGMGREGSGRGEDACCHQE